VSGSCAPSIDSALLRITDFGLARRIEADSHVTRTGQIVGTPAYMAPEQASGMVTKPGPGVDIYSLGAILFELLTGRPPFLGTDSVETIMLLLSEDPPAPRSLQPAIPPDLQTICLKCLEKKPGRRYASANELADDLVRFRNGMPILAKPVTSIERAVKWTRRNPWKAAAVSFFTLSGLVSIGGLIALQSAYSETKHANQQLSQANDDLKKANVDIRASLDLARDSLNGVVVRLRDSLYDVPQAESVFLDTSDRALELQRRLYRMQPDDHETAHGYVTSLYDHLLVEWLYGNRAECTAVFAELQQASAQLLQQFPDDVQIRVTWLKALLDKEAYVPPADQAVRDREQQQLDREVDELLQAQPANSEILKLATLVLKKKMQRPPATEDAAEYLRLARERAELARRFCDGQANTPGSLDASLWLSQTQRDLADAWIAMGDAQSARSVLEEVTARLAGIMPDDTNKTSRSEKAQALFSLAVLQERTGDGAAAVRTHADCLAFYVRLVQEYPDDTLYRTHMATALIRSAALSYVAGQTDVAMGQLSTAETQVQEILKRSPQDDAARAIQEAITRYGQQFRDAKAATPSAQSDPNP
jgi:tetratricopeptide (TPR) repeat protein